MIYGRHFIESVNISFNLYKSMVEIFHFSQQIPGFGSRAHPASKYYLDSLSRYMRYRSAV